MMGKQLVVCWVRLLEVKVAVVTKVDEIISFIYLLESWLDEYSVELLGCLNEKVMK